MFEQEALPAEVLKTRRSLYGLVRPLVSKLSLERVKKDEEAFKEALLDLTTSLYPHFHEVSGLYVVQNVAYSNRFYLATSDGKKQLEEILDSSREDLRVRFNTLSKLESEFGSSSITKLVGTIKSLVVSLIESLSRAKYFLTKDLSCASYSTVVDHAVKYS